MKEQLPLSGRRFSRAGVAPFGRSKAFLSFLASPLPFLAHGPECHTSSWTRLCGNNLASEPGTRDPFDGSIVLLDPMLPIWHWSNDARGAVLLVGALECGCMGLTASNRQRRGKTRAAAGWLEPPARCRVLPSVRSKSSVGLS